MPQAVVAAAIPAAAGLVGGIVQNRSQGKALDAQERANREAMAFQQEQARRAEEAYRQQWEQWNQGRNLLLQRYGISLPEASGPPPEAVPRGGMPGPGGPPQAQGGPPVASQGPSRMTLEEILARKNMGDPFSWQGYGLK